MSSGAARAPLNTTQATSGILQPQLTSVTQNQPTAGLNAMSIHLPNSAMLQPQRHVYTITPLVNQHRLVRLTSHLLLHRQLIGPSVTEEPPPYPRQTASNFRMGTQQMMPSPIVPHQMSGLSQSATLSTGNVPSSFSTKLIEVYRYQIFLFSDIRYSLFKKKPIPIADPIYITSCFSHVLHIYYNKIQCKP